MKGSIFTMSSGTDKNWDREISNSRSFRSIRAAKFLSERKVERLEIFRLQFLACQGDTASPVRQTDFLRYFGKSFFNFSSKGLCHTACHCEVFLMLSMAWPSLFQANRGQKVRKLICVSITHSQSVAFNHRNKLRLGRIRIVGSFHRSRRLGSP
jgi:hypothetical protein